MSQSIHNSDIYVSAAPNNVLEEIGAKTNSDLKIIMLDGSVLRSPSGKPIAHHSHRALTELAAELDYSDELDATKICLYGLFCTYTDFIQESNYHLSNNILRTAIFNDPVLRSCAGPEVIEQLKYMSVVINDIEQKGLEYPSLAQSVYFEEKDFQDGKQGENVLRIVKCYLDEYFDLDEPQEAVFRTAVALVDSPILALMLVREQLTAHEFATTYLTAMCINSKVFSGIDRDSEQKTLNELVSAANCMSRFLIQFNGPSTEIERMVRMNEGLHLEFKSTLRWNLESNCKDRNIAHEVLKTIAAFLNSEGGTLLVGINDDGEFVGVEWDQFKNDDQYLLYLRGLVSEHIGNDRFQFILWRLVPWRSGKVLRVDCTPSNRPVYVTRRGKRQFFIRTGPASTRLKPDEIDSYAEDHFPNIAIN